MRWDLPRSGHSRFPYGDIPFDVRKGTCPGTFFGEAEDLFPIGQCDAGDRGPGVRVDRILIQAQVVRRTDDPAGRRFDAGGKPAFFDIVDE